MNPKILTAMAITAICGIHFATPALAGDDATIKSVVVRFVLPRGDNKDDNTRLACKIQKDDVLIASNPSFAGDKEFVDPGEYGPYPLKIKTKVTKAQYRGSKTTLTITPVGGRGHDTIIMNTIIEAKFSDGSTLTSESGVKKTVDAAVTTFDNK
jgi:hypothetical protein